jgi:Tol biopolymer transport system component
LKVGGRGFACAGAVAVLVLCGVEAASPATRPAPSGRIVFNRFFDSSHRWGALFTVNPDGTAVRQVTFPQRGVLDEEPVWSPNGKRIAFQRVRAHKTFVFIIDANGKGERELAGCAARGCMGEDSPAWSPDGSRLAIGVSAGGGRESVWIVDASGKALEQLTHHDQAQADGGAIDDSQPAWSPDGTQLTFVRKTAQPAPHGRQALFVINVDGTGERQLTPWGLRAGHHPEWSPDGTRILFCSNADLAAPNLRSNIYSINLNGTRLTRLTHARADQQYLSSAFSPDGSWITFAMKPGNNDNAQVFLMRADGTGVREVTNSAFWDSAPDWASRPAVAATP